MFLLKALDSRTQHGFTKSYSSDVDLFLLTWQKGQYSKASSQHIQELQKYSSEENVCE